MVQSVRDISGKGRNVELALPREGAEDRWAVTCAVARSEERRCRWLLRGRPGPGQGQAWGRPSPGVPSPLPPSSPEDVPCVVTPSPLPPRPRACAPRPPAAPRLALPLLAVCDPVWATSPEQGGGASHLGRKDARGQLQSCVWGQFTHDRPGKTTATRHGCWAVCKVARVTRQGDCAWRWGCGHWSVGGGSWERRRRSRERSNLASPPPAVGPNSLTSAGREDMVTRRKWPGRKEPAMGGGFL